MTPDDTRFVLAAFRPGTEDANDPEFQEALKQVDTDPELRNWFNEQILLAAALSAKLKEIPIPPQLRADILAGAKVSTGGTFGAKKRRWPKILALAASIVITGATVFLWSNRFVPSGPNTFAAYDQDMRSYLGGFFFLDYQSKNLGEVKDWLASKHGYSGYTVPETLAGFPSLGCEVIEWHGQKAYLICFDVDGELVHLFSMPNGESMPGAPTNLSPSAIAQVGEWSTTSWVEGDKLYLVASLGDAGRVKRSLGI